MLRRINQLNKLHRYFNDFICYSGCFWRGAEGPSVEPIEVRTLEIPVPKYHPPLPGQVAFTEVKWKVLTPNTMEAYLADLKAGEASVSAYYGLTTQGYENLSNNIADLKRYLSQLKSIVKYYREIDEKPEE